MCFSPITIPNPNYGRQVPWKDCKSAMLSIPCGYCPQCIAVKQMRLVQRVEMEATKNYLFMATLTYDNEHLPRYLFDDPNNPGSVISVPYADVSHVTHMHKRMRQRNTFGIPFRFFAVSELGSRYGRPHFHILYLFEKSHFSDPFDLAELRSFEQKHYFDVFNNWQVNVGDDKFPVYENLSRYVVKPDRRSRSGFKSTYDFHFVYEPDSPGGIADVAFYVLKYMLKPSPRAVKLQQAIKMNHSPEVYKESWSVIKPRYFKSLGFGFNGKADPRHRKSYTPDSDILDYVRSGVKSSLDSRSEFPLFFSPSSGQSFPLAPFYKDNPNVMSEQTLLEFWLQHNPDEFTKKQIAYDPARMKSDYFKSSKLFEDFVRHNQQADDNSSDVFFNDLFND